MLNRSSVNLIPDDVVELILERLPVKSLLRLKSVSKMWKHTIETRRFQERQFVRRRLSRGQDILFVQFDDSHGLETDAGKLVIGSSIVHTVSFPTCCMSVCHGSCDGLVCLYTVYDPRVSVMVVNPATRWHQSLPLARTQQLFVDKISKGITNLWRYVDHAAPYRVSVDHDPVYLDGSLYWFTECKETKVLSLDLHTETFQVICKAPFAHVHYDPYSVSMCILDNCLCVSKSNWPTQDIWLLDSSGGKKMCSIDLTNTLDWSGKHALLAVAILEKNKLLLRGRGYMQPLVIHDLHTKSYELLFRPDRGVGSVCYFQSLFSASSN
ncbi:unnamed protein product [Brassica napus]|uniref:(rape) hypothetical protein n=1 Tax=Brassica napus TaxID=3708 RepID=A0A816XPL3_BRANA|nr:unnamed protein product [Brassica napus]